MKDFAGKVAVVTGAASGIGRATAARLAREGMKVVLADIEEAALEQTVQTLSSEGHEIIGVPTDVSSWEAVEALAAKTMDEFGGVNIVHNNAGVVVSGPIAELTIADWEWVLGVDLWSVIYGVKAFLPLIKQTGDGHIVNTASINGLQAGPAIAPYNVAKFGVVALTETLRRELEAEQSSVSASVLCPGAINTQIVTSKRNRPAESAKDHQSSAAEQVFEDRAGKILAQVGKDPSEVADLVVEAIVANEFWILTHPEWKNVVQERAAALARDNSLYGGYGG
ncbi:MAG: SDR family NAD(P)-dependent oxidoreductase [Gammaproteobacteria bacterium]|nr:SDR family NAD(P)-dependent oxidoreductase [Gammaproteobacteria bacterium]